MGKIFNYLVKSAGMEKAALSPRFINKVLDRVSRASNARLFNKATGGLKLGGPITETTELTSDSNLPILKSLLESRDASGRLVEDANRFAKGRLGTASFDPLSLTDARLTYPYRAASATGSSSARNYLTNLLDETKRKAIPSILEGNMGSGFRRYPKNNSVTTSLNALQDTSLPAKGQPKLYR